MTVIDWIDLIGIAYFVLVFSLGFVGLAWVLGRVKGVGKLTISRASVPKEFALSMSTIRKIRPIQSQCGQSWAFACLF